MPSTYKILGQAAPSSTANADLYTVPAATSLVGSTLAIVNTTALTATARVFIRKAGATAATLNALVYDTVFQPNSTTTLTIGLTMAATDVVTVQTGTANALTFQLFGCELT